MALGNGHKPGRFVTAGLSRSPHKLNARGVNAKICGNQRRCDMHRTYVRVSGFDDDDGHLQLVEMIIVPLECATDHSAR